MKKIILMCLLGLIFSRYSTEPEEKPRHQVTGVVYKDSTEFEFPDITLTLDLASPTKEQDSDSSFDYNGGFGLEFPVSKKITIGASYDITPFKYLGSDVNFLTLYGKYELFKMGYKLDRDKDGVVDFKIKLYPFGMIGISKGTSDKSADITGLSYGAGIYFPIHRIERLALSINYQLNHYFSSNSEANIDDMTSKFLLSLHFGNSNTRDDSFE